VKRAIVHAAILSALSVVGAGAAPLPGPPGAPPDVMFTMPLPPPGAGGGGIAFHVMGEGPAPMLPLFLHRANLTAEQQGKVRGILESDREQLHDLMTRLEQANDRLSAKLFAAGDLKLADVKGDVDEVTSLRRELMEQGLKTTLALRGIMTPEQLAKVAAVKARMDKLQAEMRSLVEGRD